MVAADCMSLNLNRRKFLFFQWTAPWKSSSPWTLWEVKQALNWCVVKSSTHTPRCVYSDHILLRGVFLLRLYFYNSKDQNQLRERFLFFFHEVWNDKHFPPTLKKPTEPNSQAFISAASLFKPFKKKKSEQSVLLQVVQDIRSNRQDNHQASV